MNFYSSVKKKTVCIILAACTLFSSADGAAVMADTNNSPITYISKIDTASNVSDEMCKADYWVERAGVVSEHVQMTHKQVGELNEANLKTKGTDLNDIESMEAEYNAFLIKTSIVGKSAFTNKEYLYINGVKTECGSYVDNIMNAINTTGYSDENQPTEYAVAVKRTGIMCLPVEDFIGYSESDKDDENQLSCVNVNEPVVIRQKCEYMGKTYYLCYSSSMIGWVRGEDLALFDSKKAWTAAWKVKNTGKDFLVVTQDKIVLEPSLKNSAISEVRLFLGTVLKLVPEDKIPSSVDDRGTWNNYVVYLPTRDENGKYKAQMALISQHNRVSIGYLDYTQKNLLEVAFSCLGNRYGWGGMLDSFDCSLYTKQIYKCFGIDLPRNTTTQRKVSSGVFDITKTTNDYKMKLLETFPAGTMLYFSGHVMMLVGVEDDEAYAISATGSLSDSQGELNVKNQYSVILNTLSARRANGKTWLDCLETAVVPAGQVDIEDCSIEAVYDAAKSKSTTVVKYYDNLLYDNVNYTVKYKTEGDSVVPKAVVTGKGYFKGSVTVQCSSETIDISGKTLKIGKKTYTYTGKKINPEVTIKGLTENKDYTVEYENNKAVGLATVTVTGKGFYSGSLTADYVIIPKKAKILSVKKGKKKFIVKANKKVSALGGTHYEIQYRKKGQRRWDSITSQKRIVKIKANTKKKYFFRIRAFATVDNVKYYGEW